MAVVKNTASVQTYVVDLDDGTGQAIFSQRYDASGNKIGDPVQVTGPQTSASVSSTTLLSDGKFVVAYAYQNPNSTVPGFGDRRLAFTEFNADGSLLGTRTLPNVSAFTDHLSTVKAVGDGAYAYVLDTYRYNPGGSTLYRTLGFVDAAGQVHESPINQERYSGSPFGSGLIYHPGEPTIKTFGAGQFSVGYVVDYEIRGHGGPNRGPEASALQQSEKFYDASGHLQTSLSTTFDKTRTVERFDTASGLKKTSTTTHTDGSRLDTEFGIQGRTYVEQSVARDAKGFVTEIKRYYGDAAHTLAFEVKNFANGSSEVHNYDTAGRETVLQTGILSGEHDVVQKAYIGDSASPVTTKLTHYGPSNKVEYTDIKNSDGSHVQQAYAAGQTLSSTKAAADTFVAFKGGADTFDFKPSFGQDTIKGFQATGANHDVLQFDQQLLGSVAELSSHLIQVGRDALIHFDDGSSVTLKNVDAATLTADNVHIVHHEGLWA